MLLAQRITVAHGSMKISPANYQNMIHSTQAVKCPRCDSGFVCNPDTGDCESCPGGYYCSGGRSDAVACPAGMTLRCCEIFVMCVHCHLCLCIVRTLISDMLGTTSQSGSEECSDCTAGTYSGNDGAVACNPCPAGTYSQSNGASSCTACDIGMLLYLLYMNV